MPMHHVTPRWPSPGQSRLSAGGSLPGPWSRSRRQVFVVAPGLSLGWMPERHEAMRSSHRVPAKLTEGSNLFWCIDIQFLNQGRPAIPRLPEGDGPLAGFLRMTPQMGAELSSHS